MGLNYTYVATFIANIIAFVSGTAIAWSSPVLPHLNVTDNEASWIGSLLALGAIFSPFIYGWTADKFGRKLTITSLAVPFIISYIILAFARSFILYYLARILMGLATGGSFTVIPMYIGEISENANRGFLTSSMNSFVTLGLLFSNAVGPYLSIRDFNEILTVIPCIFIVMFTLLVPESPYHLTAKNRHEHAEKSLNRLRGGTDNKMELEEIVLVSTRGNKSGFSDLFKTKTSVKALIISLSLMAIQQLSGINVILFYTQKIFIAAGSNLSADLSSIIVCVVQFFASLLTPLFADRLGRRTLLIISSIGMILSEVPLGFYFFWQKHNFDVSAIGWLPMVSLIGYIVFYNSGFGALPWAMMGELFAPDVKSIASAVAASFCWFLAFLITKFFQDLVDLIGMGVAFWIFAICCGVGLLFVWYYVIETKGKSFREIQLSLE